ncbi:DUF4256 domain-containing protein [Sphingobacterium sp. lm-10]|uniref:DUF4256 domain-containing protein n=1 Tax=Sphingobacterium sp. lm-10 TaxID=2944904 RepID=UPI0020225FF6|nr:DUF4256 domain-containing protein [Sphingobacterium sp. lm-10]MCL7988035.1 DUF4256 domain-containing protein [Sphingobacterium sp. lm-10]
MKTVTKEQKEHLLESLEKRFKANEVRHATISWKDVLIRLEKATEKAIYALFTMEESEGEPDVIGIDLKTKAFIFCDCAAESPKGRRSLCYDQEALESRKQNKPADNVVEVARGMGVEILDEEAYRQLQRVGKFDTKTSSWLRTPAEVRDLGGALFGDYRFGRVFVYHNGAESYYAARGFRGLIHI